MSFFFRQSRAIPIAPARDDPALMEQAFDEAARALAEGELVGIFPEGKITDSGELNPFRGGIMRILERQPAPVIPMALRGLWGSFFSRKDGPAMTKPFRRGAFSRLELVTGERLAATDVSPELLQETVLKLRGERR